MNPYYDDGHGIVIYHGDCREIVPQLGKFDLLLTDIPYGEVNRESNGLRNLGKGVADIVNGGEIETVVQAKAESFYVWCGSEQISKIRALLVAQGISTRLGIWEKTNPSPMNGQHIWLSGIESCVFGKRPGATFNEFCKSPVWRGPGESETEHPTEKPLWLFHKLILASSNKGDSILDPFAGSGTTGRAAKDLRRKCS